MFNRDQEGRSNHCTVLAEIGMLNIFLLFLTICSFLIILDILPLSVPWSQFRTYKCAACLACRAELLQLPADVQQHY